MGINFDSINNKIFVHGTSLTVTLFSGTTPQYTDDQVPIQQTTGTTRTGLILEPSQREIIASGGLITTITKKFIFPKDFTQINIGDEIYYSSGTHKVIELHRKITRVVAFGNKYNN